MIEKERAPDSDLLEMRPLREQIYEYLRTEIQGGRLRPGEFIKLNAISERLGVSKTPLRDALIQLECRGFVSILPRRGVLVNTLTIGEIKNMLEIVATLESSVILAVFHKITEDHLHRMQRINAELRRIMTSDHPPGFKQKYFRLNIEFHDIILNLSDNAALREIIMPIKQRLYDFPRKDYDVQWALTNCDEHDALIRLIREGDAEQAASLWRDRHWSFGAHEKDILDYYALQDQPT